MKFGKYLEQKARPEWREHYLDYKELKHVIKVCVKEFERTQALGEVPYSPREASLSVLRVQSQKDLAHEKFYQTLMNEFDKIGKFTEVRVKLLRSELLDLRQKVDTGTYGTEGLLEEAKRIGDEFIHLEKYVNLNYLGVHKILKKHDKRLSHAPCKQFYMAHLHSQPWAKGAHDDLLVSLSEIYSQLRGESEHNGEGVEGGVQGRVVRDNHYWVLTQDVSKAKYLIMQHLPVFQQESEQVIGDTQILNCVYLDNTSLEFYHSRLENRPKSQTIKLKWRGSGEPASVVIERQLFVGEDHSMIQNFTLPGSKVVPFLLGSYTPEQAVEDLWIELVSREQRDAFKELFEEVQRTVDSKQLIPMLHAQHMRTTFKTPQHNRVVAHVDTNISMVKINPEFGPTCLEVNRWLRDLSQPITASDATLFPHAILEIKIAYDDWEEPLEWVQELASQGCVMEVNYFSKYIHGICALMLDMVQAVPFWVDDETVKPFMLQSTPGLPADIVIIQPQSNFGKPFDENNMVPRHPLLGDEPMFNLIREQKKEVFNTMRTPLGHSLFKRFFGIKPRMGGSFGNVAKGKVMMANERTYLAWIHMALTMGSVAAILWVYALTAEATNTTKAHFVEFIVLVMIPVAVIITAFAAVLFYSRQYKVNQVGHGLIDMTTIEKGWVSGKRGSTLMSFVIVLTLLIILITSIVDLVDLMKS